MRRNFFLMSGRGYRGNYRGRGRYDYGYYDRQSYGYGYEGQGYLYDHGYLNHPRSRYNEQSYYRNSTPHTPNTSYNSNSTNSVNGRNGANSANNVTGTTNNTSKHTQTHPLSKYLEIDVSQKLIDLEEHNNKLMDLKIQGQKLNDEYERMNILLTREELNVEINRDKLDEMSLE